jgi:N-acetylglucosamine kinase-like BadF-type ATPase
MSAADSTPVVLAIDGGNIKTDLALVDGGGRLLALVRGGCGSPHALGFDGCVSFLSDLLDDACATAGLRGNGSGPPGGVAGLRAGDTGQALGAVADVAWILLAGADLPEEVAGLHLSLDALGWAPRLVVENDTLALLRTGTDRGWGVAVVCGGGINAIGIAPDGREVRFPALGAITGDWGGGPDVGLAALGAAHRSADGRGQRSSLERVVPEHFGMRTPMDVARALHFKELAPEALAELAPVVYEEADEDGAAREILDRLADEVSALAIAALERLELLDAGSEVVLGGGLLRAAPRPMIERIERRVRAVSASASVVRTPDGPIVGAALLGLDAIGAGPDAIDRARSELRRAIAELGSVGALPSVDG